VAVSILFLTYMPPRLPRRTRTLSRVGLVAWAWRGDTRARTILQQHRATVHVSDLYGSDPLSVPDKVRGVQRERRAAPSSRRGTMQSSAASGDQGELRGHITYAQQGAQWVYPLEDAELHHVSLRLKVGHAHFGEDVQGSVEQSVRILLAPLR
jgi:hypothetical protein